jgi:hypothetical protein
LDINIKLSVPTLGSISPDTKRTIRDRGVGAAAAIILCLLLGLAGRYQERQSPTPKPPGPSPTPTGEFRAVFVYESAALSTIKPDQLEALYSMEIRDYLDTHCAKGADGKTPERRFWDQNQDVSKDSAQLAKLFSRPRKSLPWFIIARGSSVVFEGPVVDAASTLATLKKYGG